MTTLFLFGAGYSSRAVARLGRFERVIGTARTAEGAAALAPIEGRVFDGSAGDPRIADDLAGADALLASIPPGEAGDPALAAYAAAIEASPRLRAIVYLSTLGVYGDAQGGPVDEDTPPDPIAPRNRARLEAEEAWFALGRRTGKRVAALRLGGIYGPGRNAVAQMRAGTARRIVKPGQVFNRIHVDDVAGAALAAIERAPPGRVYNVCDDEPAPPQDVVAHAAALLGLAPPPEIPFEAAALSPMAASFYASSKRCSNARLKAELGWRPRHPTYREGLAALLAAEDGRAGALGA